jgi:hypothetical protein
MDQNVPEANVERGTPLNNSVTCLEQSSSKLSFFESGPAVGRKHELASNRPQAKEMFIADSS